MLLRSISFTEITNNKGDTFENIWSIIEDKKGNIWIGGQFGLWRYDGNMFTNLTTMNTNYIFEDRKGNIWFTHKNSENQKHSLSRYDQESLKSDHPVYSQIHTGNSMFFGINEDINGSIWVGILDGVFRYNGNSINYFKETKPNNK